jgi:hypothetical protein
MVILTFYNEVDDHEIINDWDQQSADPYPAVSLVEGSY